MGSFLDCVGRVGGDEKSGVVLPPCDGAHPSSGALGAIEQEHIFVAAATADFLGLGEGGLHVRFVSGHDRVFHRRDEVPVAARDSHGEVQRSHDHE